MNDSFLLQRIQEREDQHALRQLVSGYRGIDFCSNDYLGIATSNLLAGGDDRYKSGSTGSRLLTGNNHFTEETEIRVADFHQSPAALFFNSGYDANTGLLSCVPQRGDTILYDALSHASIRDGLRLSLAASHAFQHNDTADLEKKMEGCPGRIFVVTESLFSMDGDLAPLVEIAGMCSQRGALLVVDEAHATGVIGSRGEGLVQSLGLEQHCFARMHTFGKALGCHGAVVLGSRLLRDYLVNFCRQFMYTTALPPVAIAAIGQSYSLFPGMTAERKQLGLLTSLFQSADLQLTRLKSDTPVQSVIIPGNRAARELASACVAGGCDVRAILYPTVPRGAERVRITLHAFNTAAQLHQLVRSIGLFTATRQAPGLIS